MIVVPFENWHLDLIQPEWPIFRKGVDFESQAVAVSLYEEGVFYAIFGAVPMWPGVMETFLITSESFIDRKFRCIKLIKQNDQFLWNELKCHRAQTTVPVTNTIFQRWLEFLGYEQEGLLKRYGPDKIDHIRYVRLADGS